MSRDSPGTCHIWPATPGSESRIKAAEHLFDHSVDTEATRRFLANDTNVLLIAYLDDDAAGFVSGTEFSHPDYAAPEMFLNELAVDESFQGRGIGRALVAELWRLAQSRGCRGMWVLTDDDNVAANKVYRAAAGERVGAQVMYQWGET
jgi:ribosomal protein S18 acetylase RimI-like enzyme